MSRMGLQNHGDRSVLDQTETSVLSLSHLNLTQAGGNVALNRNLIMKAYPFMSKNNYFNKSMLNLTGGPS